VVHAEPDFEPDNPCPAPRFGASSSSRTFSWDQEMQARIADVEERVAGEEPVRVLAYGGGTGPLILAGGP